MHAAQRGCIDVVRALVGAATNTDAQTKVCVAYELVTSHAVADSCFFFARYGRVRNVLTMFFKMIDARARWCTTEWLDGAAVFRSERSRGCCSLAAGGWSQEGLAEQGLYCKLRLFG